MPVSKSNRPAGTNLANHWLTRYVSALLAVAAAFLLRAGLARLAGGTAPPIYITFYPAVMLIALLCGLGPGLVATLAVALGVDYLILQPTNSLAVSSTADAIGLAFFTGTCVFLCVVAELYRRARQQAAEREAEEYLRDHLEPPTHWSRQGVLLNFGFVVSLGILAVAGWESARNVRAEDEATHSVTHSRLVIQDLDRLLSSLKDAETGQRGYLLTGEENYLEPYQAALGQIQSHLNDLRQLIQDTNRQQGVARIEAGIRDKEAELQQTIEVRRAQGLPAAVAVVTSGRGKATMDQIRAEAADLQNGEEGELQNRIATRNADTGNIFKALVAGSLLSFLLLTTIFLFLKRENTRRTEAEADARYHRDHLKDIVAARTAELAQSNEKLKLEIDGHLQSKEALRQQREYLRVTLTSIGDAVLVTDIAGIVTFVNPVAESLTGWPEDEVLGRPARSVFRIINEKTREPGEDIIARVLREKQTIALANHTALLARDGREIPIEDSAAPIRDAAGAVSGVVLVFHDATAKRRAQEALRESEERFRALTMASSDVVYRMSPDWREMRHLLGQGFIADTEKPSRNWLQEYIHPDDQAHLIATINEAIRTKSIFELEHRVLRVDGTLGWTLSRAIPRLDANGEIFEWFGTASDVTDLKQAELARAQLAAIVESSDDGIFSKNLDGIITSWNAGAERLLGYRPGEAIGRPVTMLLAPDRQDEESTIMARLQAGQRVEHFETIRLTKDGRRLDVSVTISPLRDAEGRVVGASKIIRDITGRKRAERQLRLLSTAVESAANGIAVTDRSGKILWINPAFTLMTGYSSAEAVGINPRILKSGRHPHEFYSQMWSTILNGEPWRGELVNRRKDASLYSEEMTITPVRVDGADITHFVAIKQDITARKRAERRTELLAETASRLLGTDEPQQIVEELCGKVLEFLDCQVFFNFLADDKQKRLHLNACAGISKAEAAKIEWLDYGVAVCGCAARDACRIVARDIQETPDPRTDMVKSFGVQAYACHPLMIAERLLGTLSFGTRTRKDFTDEELSFMKAVADLVAAAMERKRTQTVLHLTAEEAKRSNRDLEQFAYIASHDLQEPLRAVGGYVKLIQRRFPEQMDEKAVQYINGAAEGADRMERLITDLLAFSRVGTHGGAFAPASLDAVLDTALGNLSASIANARVKITRDPLPTLTVDATQMMQIFQNLIGNAIKFRSERPPEIHIGAKREPGRWVFSVRDNGIGIEPQYFDRIFQIFQRLHTRAHYPGTGIGLAICKKMVERHGGAIWVESQPGQGATFHFSLPDTSPGES